MKITPYFRWYDIWVGAYIDRSKKTVYICPLPMVGLKLDFRNKKTRLSEQLWEVMKWQNNGLVHPLTCGNDSTHYNLVPNIEDDRVILTCRCCDYKQEVPKWFPING